MLHRDHGCRRDLLWRMELPVSVDVGALADRLVGEGWRDRSPAPQVRTLEGPDGHGLVLIPRTGRIQIRVHYLVAHGERFAAAEAVRARVVQSLPAAVSGLDCAR